MFYTSKSVKLHNRCLSYLDLINQVNRRIENNNVRLAQYDACNNIMSLIRIMNRREDIISQYERWQQLSEWLETRYYKVMNELSVLNYSRQNSKETLIY